MDIVDQQTRSRMMAGIRGKNTSPEMQVRRFLHGQGFRYRLHDRKLPGRPDIVLPKYGVVVFVHGCFWHNHDNCPKATIPADNPFWADKLAGNKYRDRKHVSALLEMGWQVIIVWECGLGRKTTPPERLEWLVEAIRKPSAALTEWPLRGKGDSESGSSIRQPDPSIPDRP